MRKAKKKPYTSIKCYGQIDLTKAQYKRLFQLQCSFCKRDGKDVNDVPWIETVACLLRAYLDYLNGRYVFHVAVIDAAKAGRLDLPATPEFINSVMEAAQRSAVRHEIYYKTDPISKVAKAATDIETAVIKAVRMRPKWMNIGRDNDWERQRKASSEK